MTIMVVNWTKTKNREMMIQDKKTRQDKTRQDKTTLKIGQKTKTYGCSR
jgi:hypothetical protein